MRDQAIDEITEPNYHGDGQAHQNIEATRRRTNDQCNNNNDGHEAFCVVILIKPSFHHHAMLNTVESSDVQATQYGLS